MRVAILGTGLMGAAIAQRLSALGGFDLVLWNRTRERAEAVGVGTVVGTPAAAVEGADLVVSSLLDAASLRHVFLGEDGAAAAAVDGLVFVETSTAGPDIVRDLQAALRRSGAAIIDAPLLGSTAAVLAGTLDVPVGGDPSDVERARVVLDALGDWKIVGEAGTASQLKLLHNSMLACVTTMAAELMAAARGVGIDPHLAFWVISRVAPYLRVREHSFIESIYEPVTFELKNMIKDLDLGLDLYSQGNATTPMTALTREMYSKAAADFGELDMAAIAGYYRQLLARSHRGPEDR